MSEKYLKFEGKTRVSNNGLVGWFVLIYGTNINRKQIQNTETET